MPSVIDAFLVTLGLDSKAYTEGVKQVNKADNELDAANKKRTTEEKRRAADRDRANKSGADGLRKVRNEVLALAAIFTAGTGIKDFITNTINSAVNLGYLSANLGMSTERIKAFQLASERAGGTQEGFTAQLKESVDAIAELSTGGGPNAGMQAFFRWGGSSKDLKDGNTYLLARSKIISELFKTDPGQAAIIAKQMGISEDQFNFIKQGPAAIDELVKAQEKHAAVSKADAEAALKLKNQMLDLRDSLQQTATRVILQLAPAIERLFKQLEQGALWIAAHQDDIAKWVGNAVTVLGTLAGAVNSIAQAFGGWQNVLIGLVAIKFVGMIASLVSMVSGLAAIIPAATAASAAMLALQTAAVAAAGAAGYAVGTVIYNAMPEDAQTLLGKGLTHAMALMGSSSAQEALDNDAARAAGTLGSIAGRTPPSKPKTQPASTLPSDPAARMTSLEAKYGLPSGLLDSIWNTESGRGKNMKSAVGAEGHFQFMPATAKEYGLANPYDFNESSDAAARKMRDLLKMYGGDITQATAAYNWGQGNLNKKGMENAPKETRDYVAKVAAGMNPGGAPSAGGAGARSGQASTSTVTVDNITINTQARDAEGIAKSIKPAVEKYAFANNANSGMIQ